MSTIEKENNLLTCNNNILHTLNENELRVLQQRLQNSLNTVNEHMHDVAQRNQTCIICYDNKRNQFFDPCGHMVCCQQCGDRINTCPVCKIDISNKKIVYQ